MNSLHSLAWQINRRTFLSRSAMGVGLAALSSLLESSASAGKGDAFSHGVLRQPHHPARVKRVIWLTAPSSD